jgi:hypothetical protein
LLAFIHGAQVFSPLPHFSDNYHRRVEPNFGLKDSKPWDWFPGVPTTGMHEGFSDARYVYDRV